MGPRRELIVLIGMRRSGKSTLGAKVAGSLGLPFWDLDGRIEQKEGRSCSEIVQTDGLRVFRRMETAALRELRGERRGVLATGGGAPLRRCNRRLLRSMGRVLFLDVPLVILQKRAAGEDLETVNKRPLLAGTAPTEEVAIHWRERRASYLMCCDEVVMIPREDDDGLTRLLAALTHV